MNSESENHQNSSNYIDVSNVFKILKKRRKIILVSTLIGAILMLFVSVFVISPKYSSNTDILVNRKVVNQGFAQAQQQADIQVISTYKDVITSPRILNEVSKKIKSDGYNVSANEIKKCISITNQQNSQVFTVNVETKSPKLSAEIANTTANVFKENIKSIMSVNNVSILSKAQDNSKPVSPKIPKNVLLGLVVGLVIGLILAFVLNDLDRTVNDEEFIVDELGLNDLGIINEIPAGKVKKMISKSRHIMHTKNRGSRRRV